MNKEERKQMDKRVLKTLNNVNIDDRKRETFEEAMKVEKTQTEKILEKLQTIEAKIESIQDDLEDIQLRVDEI